MSTVATRTRLIAVVTLLSLAACGPSGTQPEDTEGRTGKSAQIDVSAQLADVDKDKAGQDEITATDAATGYDSMPAASYGARVAYQPPRWGQEASAARAAAQAQALAEAPVNGDDSVDDTPIPSSAPADPTGAAGAISPQ
ncbi:MAG: hypothetical protein JOY99_04810 [Sphingomonadaceae bacterium]|nr:hypothetical protein [Sphingomonadaceae bacterium]